jgi:hypothetical protein
MQYPGSQVMMWRDTVDHITVEIEEQDAGGWWAHKATWLTALPDGAPVHIPLTWDQARRLADALDSACSILGPIDGPPEL